MPPITDELQIPVTVGASPGSPNGAIPPKSGETTTLHARLTQEYVVGSGFIWYAQYLRSLPFAFDDLSSDFGDDIYDRMALDPQIAADVTRYKAAVLEDGITLTSPITDKDADGFDLGKRIAANITDMFEDLDGSLDDVLWDLMNACILGSRVAEQVYGYQQLRGERLLVLQSLKVKPRRATAFLVDAYANVKGILAVLPGGFSPIMIGSVLSDIAHQPNLIVREKFAVLTFRPKDNDPRGTSMARPAYRPWWIKQQIVGEYLKYLTQFASPGLLGYTPPESQLQPAMDALGTIVTDAKGDPILTTPEQAMLDALTGWRNGSVAVMRGGSKVDLVQSHGTGRSAFEAALLWCDKQIGKAMTGQVLGTEEGTNQSRSASEVHQDVYDTLVRQGKKAVGRMLTHDVLRPLVTYNWGEAAAKQFTPHVQVGADTEAHDFVAEGNALAHLYSVGYISESQKAGLDERLGLPERDAIFDAAHEAIVTRTRPEPVTAIEGAPPEAQATAKTGVVTEQGQQPRTVTA